MAKNYVFVMGLATCGEVEIEVFKIQTEESWFNHVQDVEVAFINANMRGINLRTTDLKLLSFKDWQSKLTVTTLTEKKAKRLFDLFDKYWSEDDDNSMTFGFGEELLTLK